MYSATTDKDAGRPAARDDAEAVIADLKGVGFKLTRKWDVRPYQYFYEFKGE